MKVCELKEAIKNLPDNMEVILQKDSEGNGYSPLAGADPSCIYVPETTYNGYVYSEKWTAEDCDLEEEKWSDILNKQRALVLFPVN